MINIRRAKVKDIDMIIELLKEVLNLHYKLRPDLFIPDTTKYTKEELKDIIENNKEIIFVATDENDNLLGHIFCMEEPIPMSINLVKNKTLYIDDLCIKKSERGKHIGKLLYDYVVNFARENKFYNITLNVWQGNDNAKKFYEKMGMKIKETQMEFIIGEN